MESTWLFGLLLVLGSVGFAFGSVLLVRRRFSVDRLKQHNEVTGPIHATIGVIYAVILAFVVVVVWEQFNLADEAVSREAGGLIALNHDVTTLSGPVGVEIHEALLSYTRSVLEIEWEALRSDIPQPHTTPEYVHLWRSVRSVVAADRTGRVWLASMVDRLNDIDRWRNTRLLSVETSVPAPLWILLLAGGFVTVAFAAFFGADQAPIHLLMVSTLAGVIAFTLFLITAIDHPFSGAVQVEPEAFRHALMQIEEADRPRAEPLSRPEKEKDDEKISDE